MNRRAFIKLFALSPAVLLVKPVSKGMSAEKMREVKAFFDAQKDVVAWRADWKNGQMTWKPVYRDEFHASSHPLDTGPMTASDALKWRQYMEGA